MFTQDGHLTWAAQYRTWGGIKHIWKPDNDNEQFTYTTPTGGGSSKGNLAINYQPVEAIATQDCPIRFQGQWEDAETGLYYNRYRYYDPLTGQYLSPDPIGLAGGTRPQGYVHNPAAWIDPWGLEEWVTGYRVQGGGSMDRLSVTPNGNLQLNRPNGSLNVSFGSKAHADYFLSERRSGGHIVEFQIPKSLYDEIKSNAIPQKNYKTNPLNQNGTAPKRVDPSKPGESYELPSKWGKGVVKQAKPGSAKYLKR